MSAHALAVRTSSSSVTGSAGASDFAVSAPVGATVIIVVAGMSRSCQTRPAPVRGPHPGWQVPAYTFPANCEDLAALRVVVRRGFTHDLADMLLADLSRALQRLEKQPAPRPEPRPSRSTADRHR
jgi:glutamate/tyrosine decarboxylase-like PLP-dependent enzyme